MNKGRKGVWTVEDCRLPWGIRGATERGAAAAVLPVVTSVCC